MPTAVNGDAAGPPTAGLDAVAAPPPTSTAGREDLEAEARVPPERDRAPRKAKYEEAGLRPTPALAAFGSALRRCNEKNDANARRGLDRDVDGARRPRVRPGRRGRGRPAVGTQVGVPLRNSSRREIATSKSAAHGHSHSYACLF